MMKSLTVSILIILALVFIPSDIVIAAGDYGLSQTAKTAGLAGESDLPTLVGNIIGTALSMISVLFFSLVLYGGFLWMTSRGNAEQEKKAKETIVGAVIGIIIILAAYAITNFVFTSLGPGANSPTANEAPVKLDAGESCEENSDCKSNVCKIETDEDLPEEFTSNIGVCQ